MEKMILLVAIVSLILVASEFSRTITTASDPLWQAHFFSFRPRDDKARDASVTTMERGSAFHTGRTR
jgi:hypothetical protein